MTLSRLRPALLFAVALLGCRDDGRLETHPVVGEVFVNDAPAAGCVVMFVPLGPELKGIVMPAGTADEFGAFTLTTYETGDGAPAGDYGVTLRWEANKWPGMGAELKVDPVVTMRPDRLLDRYASPEKSGLKATVAEGENVLEPFRLEGVALLKGSE
ncbi:MAG: carboxypeptidase regulatory-like domain-containing protein [Planctomycetota bacterium]|nr:carboxypeptidase regulatory-like domain-containing protein [Planctomycetaceae bacterium]MDQ3331794.1 carboxypeptidase regulatory-like domain-containing protein [Planctomycetota bacterium]